MAANLQVCELGEGVQEMLKKFRFGKKKTTSALVFKIKEGKIILDEAHEDVTVEELQAELPASQPRYIVLSYCLKHDDGRISYPLIFIFVTPSGSKPEQQMMYAGSKNFFVSASAVTKVFEIRNAEDLTEEYLKEKLAFFH